MRNQVKLYANTLKKLNSPQSSRNFHVDITRGIIVFSDRIINLLGIKSNILPLRYLLKQIGIPDLERWINREISNRGSNFIDLKNYAIINGQKKHLFSKILDISYIGNHITYVEGFLSDITDSSSEARTIDTSSDINRAMVLAQARISSEIFDKATSLSDMIDIVSLALCDYLDVNFTFTCDLSMNIASRHTSHKLKKDYAEIMADFSIDSLEWVKEMLKENEIVLINDIEDLPYSASNEIEFMKRYGTQSMYIIPVSIRNKPRIYFGIIFAESSRFIAGTEMNWLSSILKIVLSVDDLREMEMVNRTQKTELNTIFNNVPVGIELYDKDHMLIQVNDADMAIFGFKSKESIIRKQWNDNINYPEWVREKRRLGNDTEFSIVYDFNVVKENDFFDSKYTDEKKNLDVMIRNIYDENREITNTMYLFTDVTDMHRIKSRVKEIEKAFDDICIDAKIGMIRIFLSNNSIILNQQQWYDNLSIEVNETLSVRDMFVNVHENNRKEIYNLLDNYDQLRHYKDYNGETLDTEIEVKYNGQIKWLNIKIAIERGECDFILNGSSSDITQLVEARELAKESDSLKSQFLSNMSHEIRTPLNAIVGFSHILGELSDSEIEEKQEYIRIIEDNNVLLLKLINDILDLSKIEAGILYTNNTSFNLKQFCSDIHKSMLLKNCSSGVELILDSDLIPDIELYTDRQRLYQAITNFYTNALKFTSEGYVKLYCSVTGKSVKFVIEDTGSGIDACNISKIFERFSKFTIDKPGTGLGMSISKQIAGLLGGEIGVESKIGVGSKFWIEVLQKNKK